MKLEIEHWHRGYQQILSDCGQDGSVWILCRPTVDALCAARILSFLLRADHVAHHLQCCTDLQKDLQQASGVATCVVLLHMGAPQNLTKWFQGRKIYVLDPARPVHLANIHANNDIVVFWDIDETEVPSDGENLSGNESEDEESDDEDSVEDESEAPSDDDDEGEAEFEFEYQDENDENNLKNTQTTVDDQDTHSQSDTPSENESTTGRSKRPRTEDTPPPTDKHNIQPSTATTAAETIMEATLTLLTPRQWQQDRKERIERYYSAGSYYGAPAAFVAYQLATQLRFGEHTTLLWLACVGVTDAYCHGRLDLMGYSTLALQLRQACQKLDTEDSDDMVQHARKTVYAEQLDSNSASTERTKLSLRGTGRVFSQPDFKFFLLRFNSLLDAMMYSDTISTQLQLYKPAGMNKLKELLAKMGFPLAECQQPYAFMKPSLRRMLASKLQDYAEEYGLENIEYTSFLRITGYQSVLSAADAAHAAAALLDCGDDKDDMFNRALDALQSNAPPRMIDLQNEDNLVNGGNLTGNPLGYGLHLAMKLQRKIFGAAAGLMERNAITALAHFRYAYVGDEPILAKPAVLTRLAQYLFQLHRVNGKWVGRPLVLLAKDNDVYTVAGYEYTEKAGDWVRNRWGQHFALAAQSMTGTFSFGHDSHVIQVASEDVQRFLEQLHYLMDSD